jgi:AraC-like DNA-binding protein
MELLVSAKTVRAAIFAASVRTGRPTEELARLVRVSMALLADPDARLSHRRVVRVWDVLARASGDSALGLYAAQLIDSATTDRLEPLLSNTSTLGDAMQTFLRYQHLYHTGNASRSDVTLDAWIVTFALRPEAEMSPCLTDFVLGNWVRRMRRAVGRDVPIHETRLRRPRPTEIEPYLAAFGSRVWFDAGEDSLRLAPEAAAFSVVGANPALRPILEKQANADLEALKPESAFLRDARTTLESLLFDGEADVDGLARGLATSPRTLQRRLAECETSFQALLDDVRRELALRHLARGRSVTDTAFLLGFSELSAFSRAFRRWTGRTPRTYTRARE